MQANKDFFRIEKCGKFKTQEKLNLSGNFREKLENF